MYVSSVQKMASNDDGGSVAVPSDEQIGAAVAEAARYGDLDDLKEFTDAYGIKHIHYQDGAKNTGLHFGEQTNDDVGDAS